MPRCMHCACFWLPASGLFELDNHPYMKIRVAGSNETQIGGVRSLITMYARALFYKSGTYLDLRDT